MYEFFVVFESTSNLRFKFFNQNLILQRCIAWKWRSLLSVSKYFFRWCVI